MKHLKTIFACLLMAVLSIGQVWAVEYTATYTVASASSVNASGDYPDGSSATLTGSAGLNGGMLQLTYGKNAVLTISGYEGCTITGFKMSMKSNASKGKGSMTLVAGATTLHSVPDAAFNTSNWYGSWSTSAVDVDFTSVMTTDYTVDEDENIVITVTNHGTSNSTNSLYIGSYTITYEVSSSGGSTPSLSVSPTSWDFGEVAVSDEASKVFSVSGSNLTAGTLSISVPAGFSVSPSSISVTEATLAATNVTVSKNTTAIDDYSGNLSISATCGLTEAKTVALEMSVVADPEPTGTFEPFSGDIEEGDYLIVADGAGMNTTVSGNRLQYTALTLTGENYVNPDESVIWHIAESATAGYWTIYSGAESKYAAATGSNNQAQMLESGTDNKSLWEITHSEAVYTITNKSNSRFLKKNGTYGFGCYADGTVSLYKKQVEGQPKAPTFSIPGGNYETAQSVELSCETEGVTIHYTLDGTTPTNASPAYSTALAISSTTTIKAIAIKNDVSSTVASATYTIIVWQTVADVWDDITTEGPLNAHIYGYVSQTNVSGYANNFYISDNGSTEGNQLYAYRMDMNSFTVAVGDKVKLAGDLTIHNEVKEFKYTNAENCGKVIALEAKGALQSVAVSGTPIKTKYAANEDFDPTGLKVMGTYANGFVGEITEGITWGNDLTDGKVTENTTVHVTATVSEIASSAYDVAVTVAAKALVSIALSYDAVEVYQGLELPKPTVTATYSEGDPEDVTAQAVFTGYDASTTGDQEITVTYTFGGHDETANYTVTVNPIFNVELAASVARNLIVNVVGNTESTDDMIVRGKVSYINNASSNAQTYWISDDGTRTNEVEIFKGKYLSGADFTSANQLRVGDEVVVIGKVINYNNSTPEFANGKSEVQSHVRTPNFAITDVTALEVGATDLAVADLTINVEGEGSVTFASSDNTDAVTIVDGKLHAVAAGTATITANLAADGIYKAATATFDVTVIAATTKYAISFDGNGATGGDAPEFASEAAAGANITLPANTYTYTGHSFTGWKVYDENEDEVTVTAGAFTMPASPVTIKAQWAEISSWASVYTSNVTIASNEEKQVTIDGDDYAAAKTNKGASATITLPQGVTAIHLHLVAWNGEAQTVSVTGDCFNEAKELSIEANAGVSGSGTTYDLGESGTDYYFSLTPDNEVAANTVITIAAASNKRFVLFGVNQEGAVTLESISVSGTATALEYNEGDHFSPAGLGVTGHYSDASTAPITEGVVWAFDPDPLTEGTTSVSVTATASGKTSAAFVVDGLTVAGAAPLSPWASVYTSNVEIASNTAAHVTINEENFDAAKTSKGASATITLPQGVTTIHLHLVAWSGEAQTVSVTGDCFNEAKELSIEANAGVSGSGTTYDLGESGTDYYFSLTPDNEVAANTVITIAAASNKRFVLFGVNQEGGVVPVLDHIAISGIMTNTTGWKTGDEIVPEGLTVNAYYTLNEVEQAPVDVTSSVVWSHAALVEDQTEVTLTATFTDEVVKSANVNVTIDAVETGDPTIITNPASYLNFGSSVVKDAVVAPKTITVTLKNITNATATLGGTNFSAFSIDDTEIVDGDVITVSVNTATPDTYAGTVTIKDNDSETQKVINLSMTVVEPEVPETAVSTSSKWVVATEIADGMEVLITGVKSGTTYAVSEQGGNNRTTAAGTLSEDVFTPGANTMSFTLVAQGESTYALRASNGKYLYAASSGSNQLKTRDEIGDDGKAVWTISIGEGNVASIVANCETANWRNTMRFNQNGQNNPVVACYASASQDDIKLYVPKPAPTEYTVTFDDGSGSSMIVVNVEAGKTVTKPADPTREGYIFNYWALNDVEYNFATPVTANMLLVAIWTEDYGSYQRSITAGNYGTICLPQAGKISGAKLYDIADFDSDLSMIFVDEINNGEMEAGRPYLFYATSGQLTVTYSSATVEATAGEANGLYGFYNLSDPSAQYNIPKDAGNYILYQNQYWFVNSDNARIANYRAYIKIDKITTTVPVPGRRRVAMTVNGPKMPTGFENIDASDQPMKLMIDGQIYILRGEKIYDTTGRLVK